jgi:hypothetical protein
MGRHAANSKECNIVIAALAKKLDSSQNTSQTINQSSSQNTSQEFSYSSSLKSAFNLLADQEMENEIEEEQL